MKIYNTSILNLRVTGNFFTKNENVINDYNGFTKTIAIQSKYLAQIQYGHKIALHN